MWFRCSGGNGTGGGATITVTYSSQFYNKTMTCSKGSKTYTKITTSSGSTVFDVDEAGTWTITCDGTSRTVDVVLEYSTQMAITKIITVYSAASDTVSFTDVTGAKTVTTNTSGQGSVAITFIPNESIIFTSSVAKNPDDLSADYSKDVRVNENVAEVYVMPNNSLYWYGYNNGIETIKAENGWSNDSQHSNTFIQPTYNTKYIDIYASSSNSLSGVCSHEKVSYSSIHSIVQGVTAGSGVYGDMAPYSSKSYNAGMVTSSKVSINSNTLTKYDINTSGNNYIVIHNANSGNARRLNLYALWYE